MELDLKRKWILFLLRRGGLTKLGRLAFFLASKLSPPHKEAASLAMLSPKGYISPSASIYHPKLSLGENIYLGDRVQIYGGKKSGPVSIGNRVRIFHDVAIDSGGNGALTIGSDTSIHPRCQINAYKTLVEIGNKVLVAANCSFYPHDHGMEIGRPILGQPLRTKGPIKIGDNSWLGTGVIVLGGVTIGTGAVIGAGSVVLGDIPENTIAVGTPATVIKKRS